MNKHKSIDEARPFYEPFEAADAGHLRDRWITSGEFETKIIGIEGDTAYFLNKINRYGKNPYVSSVSYNIDYADFTDLFKHFWFVTGDPNNWGSRVIGKLKK